MVEGSGGDQAVLGGNGMAAPGASGDEQRVLRRAVAVESKTVPGKVLLEHLLRRSGETVAPLTGGQERDAQQNLCASDGADKIGGALLPVEPVQYYQGRLRAHEFRENVGVEQNAAHG